MRDEQLRPKRPAENPQTKWRFIHDEKTESALLMENIEALAGGGSHVPMHCVGFGTVDCPINHEKVKIVATGYSLEDLY